MSWKVKRREPYTSAGIARLKCIRCNAPARFQWQCCADNNNWRPVCRDCDVALNRLVLDWFGHPGAAEKITAYEAKVQS